MAKFTSIENYIALQAKLLKEKATLEARLARIHKALGDDGLESAPTGVASKPARRAARRARNKLSLKEAVLQVTRLKPLSRHEIADAVQRIGYKFTTKDPLNSLNGVLYSSKALRNKDGRFSPAK